MSSAPGPAEPTVSTDTPVAKDVADTKRLFVVDTCALLDLVRTEVVEGHVTALEQHGAAAAPLRSSSTGALAILAPSHVLLELDRLESGEIQRARDPLTGYVERQPRLFATLARFGLAEPPADVRIDRYLDTVTGMLRSWRQALHELPQSDAAAAAALRRVDRGDLPARAVRDRPGARADPEDPAVGLCDPRDGVRGAWCSRRLTLSISRVTPANTASSRAPTARRSATARQADMPLRREFDERGLRHVATFEEAISGMS